MLATLPWTGNRLVAIAEAGLERESAQKASISDAIVVLSLGRTVAPGPDRISEWHDADRFFAGVELFQAGKAPLLIFTGGSAPWDKEAPLEGEVLGIYAEKMGIPADSIRVTRRVFNTREEAMAVREILGKDKKGRILLVTSAMHMPRAEKEFEKAGFQVQPFPVDFATSATRSLNLTDFVPSASGLFRTSTALRELYGRLFVAIFR